MPFEANTKTIDIAKQAVLITLPVLLSELGAAKGVVLPPIPEENVYDHPRKSYEFPCCEITQPIGRVNETGGNSINTTNEVWVIITDRDLDSDALKARIDLYGTAIITMFSLLEGDGWSCTAQGYDSSPPGVAADNKDLWVQSIGVRIHVEVLEYL